MCVNAPIKPWFLGGFGPFFRWISLVQNIQMGQTIIPCPAFEPLSGAQFAKHFRLVATTVDICKPGGTEISAVMVYQHQPWKTQTLRLFRLVGTM